MMLLDDVIYQFPGDTRQGEGQICGSETRYTGSGSETRYRVRIRNQIPGPDPKPDIPGPDPKPDIPGPDTT